MSSFLDPHKEIEKRRHNLPHWQQGETWISLTYRLGDSLPQSKLIAWQEERSHWLKQYPEPWDDETEEEYHTRFSERLDHWLDQGYGSCLLKEPTNARIVADAFHHFDGKK